jgi:hypothetical protein
VHTLFSLEVIELETAGEKYLFLADGVKHPMQIAPLNAPHMLARASCRLELRG